MSTNVADLVELGGHQLSPCGVHALHHYHLQKENTFITSCHAASHRLDRISRGLLGRMSEFSVECWVSLQLSSLARSVALGGHVTWCTQLSAQVKERPPLSVHNTTRTAITPLTWPGNREYSLSSDRSTGTCWPPCSGPASKRTDCAFSLPLLSQQICPNTVTLSCRWTDEKLVKL